MSQEIQVMLVDDHPIVRQGIRHVLEREPDMVVIAEADDGPEALRLADKLTPDVLVLDVEMPGMTGYEVARQLRQRGNPVRIVVLSAHDEAQCVRNVLQQDVSAYLTKDEAIPNVAAAIRGVVHGEEGWFSRRVTAQIMHRRHAAGLAPDGMASLTNRERQILIAIARGAHNTQIATEFSISEGTVKNHITNIYMKLDLHSRAEAVALAWQHGLIDAVVAPADAPRIVSLNRRRFLP
ncbi:MAG TPA: response regulator transcription factor [Chloroflexota bacterium]|nr:response regulator transcription factor [Chloroflexota bacterium]